MKLTYQRGLAASDSYHNFEIIIIDNFAQDSWGAIHCLNCFQIIFITKKQYEGKELITCSECNYQEILKIV